MKRVALIAIVVENMDSVSSLNLILHDYAPFILGRMGLPCKERGVSLISVAVDAPQNIISTLSGKIGKLPGVSAKAVYSKLSDGEEN